MCKSSTIQDSVATTG